VQQLFRWFKALTPVNKVLNAAAFIVMLRLLRHVFKLFEHLNWSELMSSLVASGFLVSLSVYAALLALAGLFKRYTSLQIPTALLFVALLPMLYMVVLLNMMTLHLPDTLCLQLAMILMMIGVCTVTVRKPRMIPGGTKTDFSVFDVLLIVWGIHSILLLLTYSGTPDRSPFMDEKHFYFTAAQNMIVDGFSAAHHAPYDAGITYSLGVPFMAAFPAKLLGSQNLHIPFFMPLIIIFALLGLFWELRSKPVVLFFLITSLTATFNNDGWMGLLCYRLIYGEGISMIFFLLLTVSLINIARTRRADLTTSILFCLCAGGIYLTKSPAMYSGLAFWAVWFILAVRSSGYAFVTGRAAVTCLGCCLLPAFAWLQYVQLTSVPAGAVIGVAGGLHYNQDMWVRMATYIRETTPDALIYGLMALIVLALAGNKKLFLGVSSTVIVRAIDNRLLFVSGEPGLGFRKFFKIFNAYLWCTFLSWCRRLQ
jgi:hypothetical protein